MCVPSFLVLLKVFLQELQHRLAIEDELEQNVYFPTKRNNASPPVVLVKSSFCSSSCVKHDVESEFFNLLVRTGFCWTVLRSSKCFIANCYQMPLSEGGTKGCTSSGGTLVNFFLSTDKLTRPFSSSVRPNC